MRGISAACITTLLLLCSSTLQSQIEIQPLNRDILWRNGVKASRLATNTPRCSDETWVYVETLVYLYAWYQTARPTDPAAESKFIRDFTNKRDWAQACLKLSGNSSAGMSTGGAPSVPPPPDDVSFSERPPVTASQPQTDAQGRTIPQLQQLLATREQEFARDRALRAAGIDGGISCAIRSQSTGLWWAVTAEQGLHLRQLGEHTAFAMYAGATGGRVMYTPTGTALIANRQSALIGALSPNNVSEQDKPLLEFRFYFNSDGQFHIKHLSTNRFLYAAGSAIALLGPEQSTLNVPAANFTLSC
ncbi:MAG: hypothetical protein AB1762_00345 [Gemmatimonadota bacterium]